MNVQTILLFFSLFLSINAEAQYFQQGVKYQIDVALDTNTNYLQGSTQITYTNNSPEELDSFYLHLWMNAFNNKLSAYADQSIRENRLEYYFSNEKDMGGYEDLYVVVDGKRMELYAHDGNRDVVYFTLPKSLKSGTSFEVFINYKMKIPKFFSRTGRKTFDTYFMYWYPTPAVYDQEGWHPMPYLDMGEFYTEIADFDITLNIPEGFNLLSTSSYTRTGETYRFTAKDLIDFAFVLSKNKTIHEFTLDNGVEVAFMTPYPERAVKAKNILDNAISFLEDKIGAYPYKRLSIMDKGRNSSSGMEYPQLITISGRDDDSGDFEYYIVHELLHQYFYSALASNQRKYPWIDEGLTTYFQQRYYKEIKGIDHYSVKAKRFLHKGGQPLLQSLALGQANRCYHKSLMNSSRAIDPINYGLNAYEIPARMYAHLAEFLKQEIFDIGIQSFYTNWKGKHPGPKELQIALENASGKSLTWFFHDLIHNGWAYDYGVQSFKEGHLTITHHKGQSPPYAITYEDKKGNEETIWYDGHSQSKTYTVNANWTKATIDKKGLSLDVDRNNNYGGGQSIRFVPGIKLDDGRFKEIYGLPLLNFNTSDGLMAGAALFNSTFPSKRFRWAITPAYSTNAKRFVGEGWASYDHYLDANRIRKIQYKINAKTYGFLNNDNLEEPLNFLRISPHASLHFEHDAYSQKYSKLYIKPIFIRQDRLIFEEEEVQTIQDDFGLVRIGYEYYNFWNLGPSELNIALEYHPYKNIVGESHDYTKLTASAKKSFKLSKDRSLDFRVWGAYFLTNSQRQSSNFSDGLTRGSVALIHQGFNDYAFDEYFFNRNNQEVSLDNQVSYSGGGLKTPLGSQYQIGQSNDLAFAVNMKTDLPIKLPRLIPLKFFLDVGYARNKATSLDPLEGESLYSGGFMLEYGEGLFSVHLPLFQSQNISDIYSTEGKGLLGKVSFNLDLVRFNPWDIAEDFSF